MFRLTLLASVISCSAIAADGPTNSLADPIAPMAPAALKAQQGDRYFVHFAQQPLAFAAQTLRASGVQSMHDANQRLNVNSRASSSYLSQIAQGREQSRQQLSKVLGRTLSFEHQYGVVLNAAVMRLSQAEAQLLATQDGVTLVDKVTTHQLHTDSGPELIGANQIWQGLGSDLPSKGEGIVVGIIDTGIDADHPSFAATASDGYEHVNPLGDGNYLGDCQTHDNICNDKLIGVVSYSELRELYPSPNADFDRTEIIETGWDMQGHGTHVASTVAGNPLTNVPMYNTSGNQAEFVMGQISGVAPRANIVSYQVCVPEGVDGGCYPELTARALEHAIANDVDVINYSVGGGAQSPWNSTDAIAFLAARAAGIHVATSAGNSGPDPQTVGTPGNAPWITTVAAYTHDRGFSDKQLTDFSGGASSLPALDGKGATSGITAAIVDANNYGDGSCNSEFSANTFNGEIVVCRRGDIARVDKGSNVLAGGAGGLVLVNVDADIDNVESDLHVLPAIQLDVAQGEQLLNWLGSGSDHQATIGASVIERDMANADVAGTFTSRGPILPYANVLAPDVAAPGVDILAAHTTEWPFSANTAAPYAVMSGTSMSSPHVAGALALIKALRPDWTPAQAQSALMTTAKRTTFTDDDLDGELTPSTPFDAGAGRIQITQAVQAGLLLDETEANYQAADPANGGDPTTLNMASLAATDCVVSCSWTRTVTAERAGSWTVDFSYETQGFSLTASPASFSLNAGQSQQITITANATEALESEWVFGRVLLNGSDSGQQHLTAAINFTGGLLPEVDDGARGPIISVHRDSDSHSLPGFITIDTDTLQLAPFGVSKVDVYDAETTGDDNTNFPTEFEENLHVVQVHTNADTRLLSAWIRSADAPDLDLYITRDFNLDGKVSAIELDNFTCISGRFDSAESCVIDNPVPGAYLVVVHNYQGSAPEALDSHSLAVAKVSKDSPSFSVSAPESISANEPFSVELSWDQEMAQGDIYYGAFTMGTHPDLPENVGMVQFELHRGADDVSVEVDADSVPAGTAIDYTVQLLANTSGVDKRYQISTTVPAGFEVMAAEGASINGNQVSWDLVHSANAAAVELPLSIGTAGISASTDLALSFSHQVGEQRALSLQSDSVAVQGRPTAMINGGDAVEVDVTASTSTTLSAEGSHGSDGETVSYQWRQLTGPALTLSGSDSMTLSIEVPALSSDAVATIELIVTTESGTSLPVIATLNLIAEQTTPPTPTPSSSSGGAVNGFGLALLILVGFIRRRR
ncbi:S8 family serine peptidase [uncultured Ferrimonas sp.]|uniref:S8 family serine peptidase n=1 Tax=uncultured Ferrimonas sp. TaxID=432640 RepID=UPI002635F03F|nr:S8 family serine peptidase [uncultured Ferrimonas sp.]